MVWRDGCGNNHCEQERIGCCQLVKVPRDHGKESDLCHCLFSQALPDGQGALVCWLVA